MPNSRLCPSNLESIVERIRAHLEDKNQIRDLTLVRSRSLIRLCANSIRATHRHDFEDAQTILEEAKAAARTMCGEAEAYPDIYFSGYLQDAMKELAEAAITLALVKADELPDPEALGVESAPYLNGLGEAMGEMRRFALDAIRRGNTEEAERLLGVMDEVYSYLVTIDFPDALTLGLRRTTDMVRGVTERTRGDLTTAVRQEKLQASLQAFEKRLDTRLHDETTDS
ncbi:MAG: haloacid dehalogenase [Anaerolineae bacterium]|nr:haloacid dehalogenase [Anaerolineae bacterium]